MNLHLSLLHNEPPQIMAHDATGATPAVTSLSPSDTTDGVGDNHVTAAAPRGEKRVSSSSSTITAAAAASSSSFGRRPGNRDGRPSESGWTPSPEWVAGWKAKMPFQTIMRLLQVLVPQVEKICIDK